MDYDLIESGLGYSFGEGLMLIDAVAADNGTARLLGVPIEMPLLLVETTPACPTDRPCS